MRLWHVMVLMFVLATLMAIWREPVGRVAVVVFAIGLAELVLGLAAVMTLFRTVGAFGQARRLIAYAEALLATTLVLLAASLSMNGVFWIGAWLVQRVVP
jgi:hypothetical protein